MRTVKYSEKGAEKENMNINEMKPPRADNSTKLGSQGVQQVIKHTRSSIAGGQQMQRVVGARPQNQQAYN